MKISAAVLGAVSASRNNGERTRWVEGGCASYLYGSEMQAMPCATSGVGCSAHTDGKKGRGNSISFKTTMETDRTLVATAVVKTDNAGDWPSVSAGDTYMGFLRFDEKTCGEAILADMEYEDSLYLDVGDKSSGSYVIDALTYAPDSNANKNALMAQFRKTSAPSGEWSVKKQDEDKFVVSLYIAAWTSHDYQNIKDCFESAYLYVVEDDGSAGTVDYTKCALYDRYGKNPNWDPMPSPSPETTWPETTSPETTEPTTTQGPPVTVSSTPGPTPTGTTTTSGGSSEFAQTTDQIQSGLQCTNPPGSAKGKFNDDSSKIVGGVITEEGTYPWQVRLSLDGAYQCGGSIIHDNWVLTAAHCCEQISTIEVFVGDWNQWSAGDRGEFSVSAQDIIMHHGYPGPNGIANDVCLLKVPSLTQAAPSSCEAGGSNSCFASVCLPANDYNHGDACWVSGWGTTKQGGGGNVSQKMQSVGVNLFSNQYCNDHAQDNFKGATVPGLEICAGTPDNDGNGFTDPGKDSCQGDSGGPLTCVIDGQPILTGVVSWGYGCADEGHPGVYANVYSYLSWIDEVTASAGIPITGDPVTTGVQTTTMPTTTSPATTPTTSGNVFDPIAEGQTIQKGLQCTIPQKASKKEASKIVGGTIVEEGTFPWQVRLNMGGGQCGGTILSDRWVLTAAHCCENVQTAEIFIGDWRQFNTGDTGEFTVTSSNIFMHEEYPGANGISNDICLIRTPNLANKKPNSCNGCYAAACLPADDFRHGEACHVSGWGTTTLGGGGSVSNKMREVMVNLFNWEYCNNPAHVTSQMVGATEVGKEICGGTPDPNGGLTLEGKDSCQGDSGGPLTCVRDGQPVVTGVVSWGFGCANAGSPGVYANVHHYMDWIMQTTEADGFPLTNGGAPQ